MRHGVPKRNVIAAAPRPAAAAEPAIVAGMPFFGRPKAIRPAKAVGVKRREPRSGVRGGVGLWNRLKT